MQVRSLKVEVVTLEQRLGVFQREDSNLRLLLEAAQRDLVQSRDAESRTRDLLLRFSLPPLTPQIVDAFVRCFILSTSGAVYSPSKMGLSTCHQTRGCLLIIKRGAVYSSSNVGPTNR